MRKLITIGAIAVSFLFSMGNAFAVGNIEASATVFDMSGVKFNINELIRDVGGLVKSVGTNALSKSDFDAITFKIRDHFTLFSEYIRNARDVYKTTPESERKKFKERVAQVSVGYCEIEKKLELALWKAYIKDNRSRYPVGYGKPGITFQNKDCRAYGAKMLKYVMGVK